MSHTTTSPPTALLGTASPAQKPCTEPGSRSRGITPAFFLPVKTVSGQLAAGAAEVQSPAVTGNEGWILF